MRQDRDFSSCPHPLELSPHAAKGPRLGLEPGAITARTEPPYMGHCSTKTFLLKVKAEVLIRCLKLTVFTSAVSPAGQSLIKEIFSAKSNGQTGKC